MPTEPDHERNGTRIPPATAREALSRAQEHARRAAAETLETVHLLIDAAMLASTGDAAIDSTLAPAARLLEGLVSDLEPNGSGADGLLTSVAEALDAEIDRWEKRSQEDPEARAVLRAFLGVRELLWEMGVRTRKERGEPSPGPTQSYAPSRDASQPARPARVQRIRVEG
jgi:hypothetical protein